MKVEKETNKGLIKLDAKVFRELMTRESKFISELWDKVKLPITTDDDDEDYLKPTPESKVAEKKADFLSVLKKESRRAKSLEELHEKLEALRGKKLDYKGKLLKKSIQNKAIKKKKQNEKKLKKTLVKTGPSYGPQDDTKQKPQKPIFNSEGDMVFSKFDFSESRIKTEVSSKKGKEDKNPHNNLRRLEKQNQKLKDLETQGNIKKATEIREKLAWRNALVKAEGSKVKDNPELLKKTVKKEMKKKQKSKKEWDARIENVRSKQEAIQKKRQDNILARKRQVKLNKIKKAVKRGRLIPGF